MSSSVHDSPHVSGVTPDLSPATDPPKRILAPRAGSISKNHDSSTQSPPPVPQFTKANSLSVVKDHAMLRSWNKRSSNLNLMGGIASVRNFAAPSPANTYSPEENPLTNIPIEISTYEGQVRITALAEKAVVPAPVPLSGVRSLNTETQEEQDAAKKAATKRRCWPRRIACFDSTTPLDTYVRVTLMPSGIGGLTEVVLDSGNKEVKWKTPQKMMLHYSPLDPPIDPSKLSRPQSSLAGGNDTTLNTPNTTKKVQVVVNDVASVSSTAGTPTGHHFFMPASVPPSPSLHAIAEVQHPRSNSIHRSPTDHHRAPTTQDLHIMEAGEEMDDGGEDDSSGSGLASPSRLPSSAPLSPQPHPPPPPPSPPQVSAPHPASNDMIPRRSVADSVALSSALRDDPLVAGLTNSSTCSTASTTPAGAVARATSESDSRTPRGPTPTLSLPPPALAAGTSTKEHTSTHNASTSDLKDASPQSPSSDPITTGPMLLIEVICCAPERNSSYPCVEEDRLVATVTYDLKQLLDQPLKMKSLALQLIDVEQLDEVGEIELNLEFYPDPVITAVSPKGGHSPISVIGAGTIHVEVLSIKNFNDPFNPINTDPTLDWSLIRNMIVVVFFYLAAGVAFYLRYEDWSFLDAVYFCLVTATTTGYGDLHPTTDESRVFTIFFVLVGIGMIAIALGIAGGLMLERQEQEIYKQLVAEREARANFNNAADTEKKKPWLSRNAQRLLWSFFMFNTVLFGGAIGFYYFEGNITFLHSIYLCVVTMSTVGYGDVSPKTNAGRAFCCPWIVISALVVTRVVGEITDMYMAWTRNKRAEAVLKNSVNSVEDLAALDDDNSGQVSELEFLKHMLVKTNACKQNQIDTICDQFHALDADGSGFLDADDFKKMEQDKIIRRQSNAVQLGVHSTTGTSSAKNK